MASWVVRKVAVICMNMTFQLVNINVKVHLQPVPQWIQGVYAYNGDLYVTADDGTADEKEPDHIYRCRNLR